MNKEKNNEIEELKEVYDNLRERLLEEAQMRDLIPEYAYENQSSTEVPESFIFQNDIYSIRGSRLFEVLVRGSLDKLKEIIDNPEIFQECIIEIFGTYDEYYTESQLHIENEEAKEAA